MLKPLFTYPIKETAWLIVVAKGASHFYFNSETSQSVWQLFETNIEDFASRVNFDELAVLFAKANGLIFRPREESKAKDLKKRESEASVKASKRPNTGNIKKESTSQNEPPSSEVEINDSHELITSQKPVKDEDDSKIHDNVVVSEERSTENPQDASQSADQKQPGLDLGYSSSEDDEDINSHVENDVEGSENESETGILSESDGDEGVNSGLDLALDSDDDDKDDAVTSAKADFEDLLESLKDEISEFDPWFLVEEELLPKLSQSAAFYGIPDVFMRENIFDEWNSARTKKEKESQNSKIQKYPTAKMRFFRFLQEFKSEVRKVYYLEFHKTHAAEIEAFLAQTPLLKVENLFREFRVTMNDYADYEKAEKKRGQEGNLKVAHVEAYLRRKLIDHNIENMRPQGGDSELDSFDRWMQLCNDLSLPETVVSDATNFVVGDEKRLGCYLRVLGLD